AKRRKRFFQILFCKAKGLKRELGSLFFCERNRVDWDFAMTIAAVGLDQLEDPEISPSRGSFATLQIGAKVHSFKKMDPRGINASGIARIAGIELLDHGEICQGVIRKMVGHILSI